MGCSSSIQYPYGRREEGVFVSLHSCEWLWEASFMPSRPALCEYEVLDHRDGNETIDDPVHHDRFCLDPSGQEKWLFECFNHCCDATLRS